MTYLLDTHIFLWMLAAPERLGDAGLQVVADPGTRLLLSAASAWEIAIKSSLGRLTLPGPAADYVPSGMHRAGIAPLPVSHAHALAVAALPGHHGDPFDRLLVAQAQVEGLTLISADPAMSSYDVPLLLVDRAAGG